MIPNQKIKELVETGEVVQAQPYAFVGKMNGTRRPE